MKKPRILAPCLLACALATSCIGPFNTFNGLASWNSRATESKILNELIFAGLVIIPVYQLAGVADALIFNSVEFWGAENPIGEPKPFQSQAKMKD